jgi:hypothetical protein
MSQGDIRGGGGCENLHLLSCQGVKFASFQLLIFARLQGIGESQESKKVCFLEKKITHVTKVFCM